MRNEEVYAVYDGYFLTLQLTNNIFSSPVSRSLFSVPQLSAVEAKQQHDKILLKQTRAKARLTSVLLLYILA